jgi:uncharacterized membrane protein YfcA
LEIVLGFLIALMIGLTGVGGGVLTVPVLILYLGIPTATAVGTALSFSALVKVPACAVYLHERKVDGRVLRYLLLGGVPGVAAGSLILSRLAGKGLESLVLTVVGLTIAATAALNLARLWRNAGAGAAGAVDRAHRLPWLTLPIGLEVGFSSAGAGALGTLVLLHFTVLAPAQVVGTDLVFGLVLSALGGGLHVGLGQWDPGLFGRLVLGGLPGALLGARLTTVLPARLLRVVLLLWLVYLGSQLLGRGLRTLAVLSG